MASNTQSPLHAHDHHQHEHHHLEHYHHPAPAIGSLCWFEIPVQDVSRAQRFYTELFGWDCSGATMQTQDPHIKALHPFKHSHHINGAFAVIEPAAHVRNYSADDRYALSLVASFAVPSVKETSGRVEQLGGTVHLPEIEIPNGMGSFARIIDSENNLIGIWSSPLPTPASK